MKIQMKPLTLMMMMTVVRNNSEPMRGWRVPTTAPSGSHLPNYADPPKSNGPEMPSPISETVRSRIHFINQARVLGSHFLCALIHWCGICSGSTWIGSSPPCLMDHAHYTFTPQSTHPSNLCSTSEKPSTDSSHKSSPLKCVPVSVKSNTEFASDKPSKKWRLSRIHLTPTRSTSRKYEPRAYGLLPFTPLILHTQCNLTSHQRLLLRVQRQVQIQVPNARKLK